MPEPIDPLTGPRYALTGKLVTMDDSFTVLNRGTVYISAGEIKAVQLDDQPPPPEFQGCPLIQTGGTLYPGLIELHNHLSYNVLPLWEVPKKFNNRGEWGGRPEKRKLISGPMSVLGRTPGYVEAIVRYVECKCLLGGVTTSQGIALFSNNGIRKFYRGIVRNVEQTDEADLPEASTRISDVEAEDAEKFQQRLERSSCLLLHLSEGIDQDSREHFKALQLPNGEWAITPALAGIHSAGLHAEDLTILASHGGSMVWSPLSNLLLYGDTARMKEASQAGLCVGIGSDWSPTGSKNLLGELKVARLYSQEHGSLFTDREILAMATVNPARILGWDPVLGSIEPGKRADLLVVAGQKGDPYERLLNCRESSIILVVINGVPRYGQTRLMKRFGEGTEDWRVAQARRRFYLKQDTADPVVGELTLEVARDRLVDGMERLPELARELELPSTVLSLMSPTQTSWFLVLDHDEQEGETLRPHLPSASTGEATAMFVAAAATTPLSQLLKPINLDPLTVVDDPGFLDTLRREKNLPAYINDGLEALY